MQGLYQIRGINYQKEMKHGKQKLEAQLFTDQKTILNFEQKKTESIEKVKELK